MRETIDLRRHEFLSYLRSGLRGNSLRKEKFVLVCHYRSGSTLLANLLNSHSRIHCDGEIFLPFVRLKFKKLLSPYTYIKYRASKSQKAIYGFDLKISQLIQVLPEFQGSPEEFMQALHQDGWKIIYLKRLNILRQGISSLVARSRDRWNETKKKSFQRPQVFIDLEKLEKRVKTYENSLIRTNEVLHNLPYCEIIYESDLLNSENHQNTLDRIFDYLGVESMPVKTKFKKTSQKDLARDIENYQEVVDFIAQTDYAKFLEID